MRSDSSCSHRLQRIVRHLDACYSCYHYGEGYFVEDDHVVCRACRYACSIREPEWDYIGGCAPIPLSFELDDSSVIINDRSLKRAARFF